MASPERETVEEKEKALYFSTFPGMSPLIFEKGAPIFILH